jgi:ornithine cyclodeaminase/alanine dehydrogenase-like protein (mu-crystallin family)
LLTEADVAAALPMPDLIGTLEDAFRAKAAGQATNQPRTRVLTAAGGVLHMMSAGWDAAGVMGLKAYATGRGGARFVVLLYSADGTPLAQMEADTLGQRRTGAATGLATKHMARADAFTVAILGSGWQARTQLEAVCAVRAIRWARVYSRTHERREHFASEMSERTGVPVEAAPSAEQAVREAAIVCTITTAREPVLAGEWLQPGVHVNAAGVNWADRRELDAEAVRRATRIAVDDLTQAKIECGDLIWAASEGAFSWESAVELADVVAGRALGRGSPEEITLFASQGVALEDVAAAKLAYDNAVARGISHHLDLGS